MAEKKRSFWEKYAHNQLAEAHSTQQSEDLYKLSEEEIRALKRIRKITLIKAAIAGTLGVVILYIPYHLWQDILFPEHQVWIPFYEDYIPLEIEFLVYSLVLVVIEIYYLTFLNIKAVAEIAHVCGTGDPEDPNYENNLNALIAVGLEKRQKQLEEIGINPYEGLNKYAVLTFQILLKLKAAASGFLFKLLVVKALGRYALRVIVDYAGIPIYAFWNAWGANRIMNDARVRVMAPPLIRILTDKLYEEQQDNPEFKTVVFDTLQAISISKRSFHYNHYLLAVSLLEKFNVAPDADYDKHFLENVDQFNDSTRNGIAKLLTFGILLDGRMSRREKRALDKLQEDGVLPYSYQEIQSWGQDYFEGRGLETLITK